MTTEAKEKTMSDTEPQDEVKTDEASDAVEPFNQYQIQRDLLGGMFTE